jgi:hypothetical protein
VRGLTSHSSADERSKFSGDNAQVSISAPKLVGVCCLPPQKSPTIGTGTCVPVYMASHRRTTGYCISCRSVSRVGGGEVYIPMENVDIA